VASETYGALGNKVANDVYIALGDVRFLFIIFIS
jgi:hypothetical protein